MTNLRRKAVTPVQCQILIPQDQSFIFSSLIDQLFCVDNIIYISNATKAAATRGR